MTPTNVLDFKERADFREWLMTNGTTAKECWIAVRRGKTPPEDALWYLDAVEEALCFGWIDSTQKRISGVIFQRFSRRNRKSRWTELNKERCRRLIRLGLMTPRGLAVCPDLNEDFSVCPEILRVFKQNPVAWDNFNEFPALYKRVRIDNIQRVKENRELFESRLNKLIEASECGKMIGDWCDYGRLL